MRIKNIERSIIKYLTQEADSEDLNILSEWIKEQENQIFFENYVKTHFKITLAMSTPNINEIKKNLVIRIKMDQNKVRKLKIRRAIFKYAAAAAILVIALATTYLLRNSLFNKSVEKPTPIIVNNQIEPGTDKATLTLENGSIINLEKGNNYRTPNATSNGEEIVYSNINSTSNELVFNYLTVPRGGQFYIELSDGTRVWLNSESKLKFPVSFKDSETRQVELIYGEAYFEVSPSTKHKGSKFKVFNNYQEVEVLGTEFNIKAYKDEKNIFTTLVEGKVTVSYNNKKESLTPSEQSVFNLDMNSITIKTVDVYNEISWKDGIFSFERKTLKEIMKVLSRWYDVEIIIKNKSIENEEFVGVLRKNKKLEDILTNFKKFEIIKNFEIMDDKKAILE